MMFVRSLAALLILLCGVVSSDAAWLPGAAPNPERSCYDNRVVGADVECLKKQIGYRHAISLTTSGIYTQDACGSVSPTQKWCIDNNPLSADYGYTIFSPTVPTTGLCGATGSADGTCITYISETGTGTLATCRVPATVSFDITYVPPNSAACPYENTYIAGARDASSDFVLFKRDDCFMERDNISPCTGLAASSTNAYGICTSSGRGCAFNRNGASRDAPLYIGAYGPRSGARPRFSAINTSLVFAQNTSGDNIAIQSIHGDGGWLFNDYKNSTYNPGIMVATTGCAGSGTNCSGQTSITLPSVIPTNLVNSVNALEWSIFNFSNASQILAGSQCTGIRLTNISGTSATALANIPINWDINVGDRLAILPFNCNVGTISFLGGVLRFNYVEDVRLDGGGIGLNKTPGGAPLWDFRIRRNVINGPSGVATRTQGIFLGDSFNAGSTVLAEENTIDHDGWRQNDNDCTPAQFMPAKCNGLAQTTYENYWGNPNNQAQNFYDHEDCCFLTASRNFSANSAANSIQVRAGGIMYNNTLIRNPGGQNMGAINHPNTGTYNVMGDNTASYMMIAEVRNVVGNTLTFDAVPQAIVSTIGAAMRATPAAAGSGYTNGTQTLTVLGGTCTVQPQFSVTVSGNAVQSWPRPTLVTAGQCNTPPTNAAATSGGGGTGATLTVSYTNSTGYCVPFNASNPTGISQTLNTTFSHTLTTMTINGPAISAAIGDIIYCVDGAHFGLEVNSLTTNPGTMPINNAGSSNIQWNIHTGQIRQQYIGKSVELGWGFNAGSSLNRATGVVYANNYVMNLYSMNAGQAAFNDYTQIQGVTGTGCGGLVGITLPQGAVNSVTSWKVGDTVSVAGTLPSSLNADNPGTTVASVSGNTICLAGTTFGTGTWTSGTGLINGGIGWGSGPTANRIYNVAQPVYTPLSASLANIPTPTSFTPVVTSGCPQAAGCPSIEGYAISSGLGNTLPDVLTCAKNNRWGSFDQRCTAAAINNGIRTGTDGAIALQ